jgi:hypothetical protein
MSEQSGTVSHKARQKPILSWEDAYLEAETEIVALKVRLAREMDQRRRVESWLRSRLIELTLPAALGGIVGGFLGVIALRMGGF